MRYLLDVNALIAFAFQHHQFHDRVVAWIRQDANSSLLTCSLTELGLVRILAHTPEYRLSVTEARSLLLELKENRVAPLEFVFDGIDISRLPGWVKTPKQTTDGHLAQLAAAHGARLATLDRGIPGAFLIP
jgi:uncharacterized protein